MGNYIYLIVAAFVLTAGTLLVGIQRSTSSADHALGRYDAKIEARNIAHSGLSLTLRKFGVDPDPWIDSTEYSIPEREFGNGTFSSSVRPFGAIPGDTVAVTVVGRIGHITKAGQGRDTTHTIEALVVRGTVAAIPPGFRNAITTDNYLLLQGSMEVRSMWPNINANVHTNGTLRARGNDFVVEGYGTYTSSTTVRQEDNFTPNLDWNGGAPNVFQKDSVHLPLLNMDFLRSVATQHELGEYVIDGDVFPYGSFQDWGAAVGRTDVGTLTNPFILVVEGDLLIENLWDMEGYGMIVTASNAVIEPTGSGAGPQGRVEGYNTTMGLYAVGNITVEGNAVMTASMYSHAKVTFHGTPTLTGGIVAKETHFLGGGNPIVTYVGPSVGIVKPGFTFREAIGPVIVASAEW
jgi:hypothetical protein